MTKGKEIIKMTIELPDGTVTEQAFIREECGNIFSLEASYVEQEVDVIVSPHNNGVVELEED